MLTFPAFCPKQATPLRWTGKCASFGRRAAVSLCHNNSASTHEPDMTPARRLQNCRASDCLFNLTSWHARTARGMAGCGYGPAAMVGCHTTRRAVSVPSSGFVWNPWKLERDSEYFAKPEGSGQFGLVTSLPISSVRGNVCVQQMCVCWLIWCGVAVLCSWKEISLVFGSEIVGSLVISVPSVSASSLQLPTDAVMVGMSAILGQTWEDVLRAGTMMGI